MPGEHCRELANTHGNVELAQVAASHLFELEPESPGSPVLLSNTFMDMGKWEEATRLKKMVKKKKPKTSVGCSWLVGDLCR